MKKWLVYTGCVIILLSGCGDKKQDRQPGTKELLPASLEALAPAKARDSIRNIITEANCTSPQGAYTTVVHTENDYMYFRQEYTYTPQPFQAILINDSTGYATGDTMPLPREAVYTIRSHAFHALLFELPQRYHAAGQPDTVTMMQGQLYFLKAKDELGNDCTLFFDKKNSRLSSLEIKNPDKKEEAIRIVYSDWKQAGPYLLPYHIDIFQGNDIFKFDFTKIEINDPGFKKQGRNGSNF